MYYCDLDTHTKARLQETHDTAKSQRHVPHHLPKWMRRAAVKVAHKLHLA